ncbi:MAG: hypothetical protein HGA24_12285, partial [Candidatus Aminicenantes bacterium]|nr:hypothetical protein [Candidatus Aminicenantes bacterium]
MSRSLSVSMMAAVLATTASPGAGPKSQSTWPQEYSVARNDAAGTLSLRTPYYSIEHDLRRGGAISRVTLTHGRAPNLLVRPIETRVRDEGGAPLTDLRDSAPLVTHRAAGLNEIVMVDSSLMDAQGRASGLRVKTTFEYRWGYVKIHKEILPPSGGVRLRELCPVSAVLAPTLTDYGYREGIMEEE